MSLGQYMEPEYVFNKCIKKIKDSYSKDCKYLQVLTVLTWKGKEVGVYHCSCEDDVCAGCVPTFENENI